MFEIGTTLRDARVRRDISLQKAEADTKIRVKYIQAMENEDFDVLPAGTYVKGFLRTYAEYLGIDYQLILDEYNDRYGTGDHKEHLVVQTGKSRKPGKRGRSGAERKSRKQTNYLFVAIFAVLIIAVLAYLGWGNSTSEKPTLVTTTATGADTVATATVPAETAAAVTPTQTQPRQLESLVLTADVEDSWVRIRKDNEDGEIIWENVLAAGESKTFTFTPSELPSNKLILNIGNTLLVEVNGQSQRLNGGVYIITPDSVAELP
jgi:cytoskeletal protein RodZ